jgi:transcriptional regulator with XRE-family HTH domain
MTTTAAARSAAAKAAKTATASRARKAADTLPNRVRAHREAADLSPKDLANRIGSDWTASTVRRIERGARKPSVGQIAQLAAALGVPAADLGFPAETLPQIPAEPRKKVATAQAAASPQKHNKLVVKRAQAT